MTQRKSVPAKKYVSIGVMTLFVIMSLFIIGTTAGCGENAEPSEQTEKQDSVKSDFSVSTELPDTLIVKEKTIVFIEPDSLRKAQRIAQMGVGTYEGESTYFQQYLHHAATFAERAAIRVMQAENADIFLFPAADSLVILRDSLSSPWSLIMYEPGKMPETILPSDIRTAAATYFYSKN